MLSFLRTLLWLPPPLLSCNGTEEVDEEDPLALAKRIASLLLLSSTSTNYGPHLKTSDPSNQSDSLGFLILLIPIVVEGKAVHVKRREDKRHLDAN